MLFRLAVLLAAGPVGLLAQETPLDPQSSIKINLPNNSPVALVSANMGESRATARGSATVVDLHMALSLRNTTAKRISGITLLVTAQEFAPGGKGSVATPSLSVGPGEAFPMRVDLQLLRPAQMTAGPLVQVTLDGVLFQDLSFYGPNRLDSRRSLTAWEMEAQRDRQHFKACWPRRALRGCSRKCWRAWPRQAERPRLNVAVSRGRAVTSAALGPEHMEQFAFLQFPDSPVQPVEGWAQIAGNEARAPRIEVRNRSSKPVRYVEIGWVVKDRERQAVHGRVGAGIGSRTSTFRRAARGASSRTPRCGSRATPGSPSTSRAWRASSARWSSPTVEEEEFDTKPNLYFMLRTPLFGF